LCLIYSFVLDDYLYLVNFFLLYPVVIIAISHEFVLN